MSYEGYTQKLCSNGHYHTYSAFYVGEEDDNIVCPICSAKMVWSNEVDDTNGDEYGFINMKHLLIKEGSTVVRTFLHGDSWETFTHTIHPVYRIPGKDEKRRLRSSGRSLL